MVVPNYKWTHDFIERSSSRGQFLSGLYFFRKKHKQKYKQINRKFSKMEMMNKCHFFGAISRKKENPRQATPSCAPLK